MRRPASTGNLASTRRSPPGRDARREFEYARHGTISIIAAMNVATGEVVTERIARNDSATFTRFLAMLHQIIPPHLRIHLIMDNGSSRTSRTTRAWLTAHPRFAVTYTPKHAFWLNMVELGTVHGAWLPAAHTPAVLALMLCPGWLAAMMLSWLICAPRANRNHPPVR